MLPPRDIAMLPTVATAAVGLVALWTLRHLLTGSSQSIKSPRQIYRPATTLPLLGNILDQARNDHRLHDWMLEQTLASQAEPWAMSIPGFMEIIFFSKADAIEEITSTQFDNFPKGPKQIESMRAFFGEGLVASDGQRWYHQRKTAAKFFSAKTLRVCMMRSMRKNVGEMYEVFDRAIATGAQVDLGKLFHEFTLQTFAEVGLGLDFKWIGSAEPHEFEHSLDEAAPVISRRFRLPMFWWKLERWLGVGPERLLSDSMKVVYGWLRKAVAKSIVKAEAVQQARLASTRNEVTESVPDMQDTPKSAVELFVEHSREDADGIRPEDIVDFLLTFIIGARDTTALTLTWLCYALGQNSHVLAKIRGEMAAKLPQFQGDADAYLTTDHIRHLTYLEATIKETIRLYPAAPYTLREAMNDTVLCGDIPVRKGQCVGFNTYAMARNPVIWGPDAADFKPERWIDPMTGQILNVPSTKFFSFSSGPRTCVGVNLAMLELRIVTANLLRRYDVVVDPANDGTYVACPVLIMKHPLWAHVARASRP